MKKVVSPELNKLVSRTVKVYNRYRSPEAMAKLLSLEEDGFTIEFEGAFCQSCGMQDYFEDFVYELKGLSKNVEVKIEKSNRPAHGVSRCDTWLRAVFPAANSMKRGCLKSFFEKEGYPLRTIWLSTLFTKDVIRFHFRTWLFETKSKRSNSEV